MKDFSVTVVILATDETHTLTKTVDYIVSQSAEKIDKTLIILSRKATCECVTTSNLLKSKYAENVEVVTQKEDGLGNAALYGMEMVKTSHMTFFPADLAIEVECLERMISIAKNNKSLIVKTSRWLEKGSFVKYNKVRYFFNILAQKFLKILFRTNLTDLTNPVQLMPTNYEKNAIWKEKGFCALIEHAIVPVRLGYEFVEVPVKCLPRTEGESKNSWIQTALYLKTAIRVRLTRKDKLLNKKTR